MPTSLAAIKKFKGIVKYGLKLNRACSALTNEFYIRKKDKIMKKITKLISNFH